ncbi:hypothetical protein PTI98_013212 [Pleurotus ostreatus]|nr:hypothetical protein PTI98_013212 [Pleurotus ostreatus]
MKSDSDEYEDGQHEGEFDGVIWHAPHSLSPSPHGAIRARVGVYGKGRDRDREGGKLISTTPGMLGAGETETEADEPFSARTANPLLFEFSRLLSVVPAIIGTLYNLYFVFYGTGEYARGRPEKVDYAVAALWSILTGFQCLALTTGLLTRWRIYYTPLSTLVRLLGLQAICWPATNWTLRIFDGGQLTTSPSSCPSFYFRVTRNVRRRRETPGDPTSGGSATPNTPATPTPIPRITTQTQTQYPPNPPPRNPNPNRRRTTTSTTHTTGRAGA